MNERKNKIEKLVKECATVNLDWNWFSIKMIKEGIGKFHNKIMFLI